MRRTRDHRRLGQFSELRLTQDREEKRQLSARHGRVRTFLGGRRKSKANSHRDKQRFETIVFGTQIVWTILGGILKTSGQFSAGHKTKSGQFSAGHEQIWAILGKTEKVWTIHGGK